jgi:hypothetical protein
VAALTLLTHSDSELSLQQHLDLAPELLQYNRLGAEAESDYPLTMAAQPVPHLSTDRRRVKVYELRNNDWFDRGTGFCTATFNSVRLPLRVCVCVRACACALSHSFCLSRRIVCSFCSVVAD